MITLRVGGGGGGGAEGDVGGTWGANTRFCQMFPKNALNLDA